MKLTHLMLTLLVLSVGCSPKQPSGFEPAPSVEELKERVKSTYYNKDPRGAFTLIQKENTPKEVLDFAWKFFQWAWSAEGYKITELELYPVAEHESKMNLPGELNGRKLIFSPEPLWWLRLTSEKPNKNPELDEWKVELEFPVAEENGVYFICGGRYK